MKADDAAKLGPCCVCESTDDVRTIVILHQKAPIPGRGWGCLVCDLAFDGAIAVVCDPCAETMAIIEPKQLLHFACRGWPGVDGRVPIETLTGAHDHDLSKHPTSDTCGAPDDDDDGFIDDPLFDEDDY